LNKNSSCSALEQRDIAKSKMTMSVRGIKVKEQLVRKAEVKKNTEKEKLGCVGRSTVRRGLANSNAVWCQEGVFGKWPPCLNPTDRSPCLTGDGNQ